MQIRELHFKVSEIRKGLGRHQFEAERKSLVALKQSLGQLRQFIMSYTAICNSHGCSSTHIKSMLYM